MDATKVAQAAVTGTATGILGMAAGIAGLSTVSNAVELYDNIKEKKPVNEIIRQAGSTLISFGCTALFAAAGVMAAQSGQDEDFSEM